MPVDTGSDLSQRVMRAAKDLFFVRGYVSTPLRAIANEAGTSESGVLRMYHSKPGLLRAVYAEYWAEMNAAVEDAIAAAAARDPDPRNLLVELMRTVLQIYAADPSKSNFIISHFGYHETTGLSVAEGIDPVVDSQVRREYHRYLDRIHSLCEDALRNRPDLLWGGATPAAIGHFFISIVHGIQLGWYMASQEPGTSAPEVSMEEALAGIRSFMYPEARHVESPQEEV